MSCSARLFSVPNLTATILGKPASPSHEVARATKVHLISTLLVSGGGTCLCALNIILGGAERYHGGNRLPVQLAPAKRFPGNQICWCGKRPVLCHMPCADLRNRRAQLYLFSVGSAPLGGGNVGGPQQAFPSWCGKRPAVGCATDNPFPASDYICWSA